MDTPYAETLLESGVKIFNRDRYERHLRINCPWCEENWGKADDDGHMYFFLDSSIAHCMRCRARWTVVHLFRKLGLILPVDYSEVSFPGLLLREKFDATFKPKPSERPPSPPEMDLPEGTLPINYLDEKVIPHRRILRVLQSWNLDMETLEELRWGWNGRMNCFIFPVYDDEDRLIFWSARALVGNFRQSASGEFSKYGICGEYWHPLQKSSDVVHLVEGPKDAAALIQDGYWGVYLFGHNPSPAQIERLNVLPHTKVFLLDSDVTAQARDLSERLGWKVIFLPSGDPADYAGRMTGTLEKLWKEQSEDARERRFAELRQQLNNRQVHRSLKKR